MSVERMNSPSLGHSKWVDCPGPVLASIGRKLNYKTCMWVLPGRSSSRSVVFPVGRVPGRGVMDVELAGGMG